eukprot:ctg_1806.g411
MIRWIERGGDETRRRQRETKARRGRMPSASAGDARAADAERLAFDAMIAGDRKKRMEVWGRKWKQGGGTFAKRQHARACASSLRIHRGTGRLRSILGTRHHHHHRPESTFRCGRPRHRRR